MGIVVHLSFVTDANQKSSPHTVQMWHMNSNAARVTSQSKMPLSTEAQKTWGMFNVPTKQIMTLFFWPLNVWGWYDDIENWACTSL